MATKKTEKVTKPKVEKPKSEPLFKVKLILNNETFTGGGDNLYKVFRSFPTPSIIKTETNILVTKGGKTVQKDLKVIDARRSFAGYDTTSLELLAISIAKMLP